MSLRIFRTLCSLVIIVTLAGSNISLAQNSAYTELTSSSQLSYGENYPYFFQPEQTVLLSTMINGLVTEVDASPQDYVKKDDVLLRLDDEQTRLEIQSLKDQIELNTTMAEAKIRLEFAEDNFKIVEELYNQQIGEARVSSSKERKEALQSRNLAREAVKTAELEMRMLKSQLALRNKILGYHTVTSPIDGVVVPFSAVKNLENQQIKQIRVGEVVQTISRTPLIAIMQVDKLRVRFKQSRDTLKNVKLGQKAEVYVQGFSEPATASVVYIEPTIIEALDEFYIEVQVDNKAADKDTESKYPFQYRPGMRVRVELTK